jgi:hypothetical protein
LTDFLRTIDEVNTVGWREYRRNSFAVAGFIVPNFVRGVENYTPIQEHCKAPFRVVSGYQTPDKRRKTAFAS